MYHIVIALLAYILVDFIFVQYKAETKKIYFVYSSIVMMAYDYKHK